MLCREPASSKVTGPRITFGCLSVGKGVQRGGAGWLLGGPLAGSLGSQGGHELLCYKGAAKHCFLLVRFYFIIVIAYANDYLPNRKGIRGYACVNAVEARRKLYVKKSRRSANLESQEMFANGQKRDASKRTPLGTS